MDSIRKALFESVVLFLRSKVLFKADFLSVTASTVGSITHGYERDAAKLNNVVKIILNPH